MVASQTTPSPFHVSHADVAAINDTASVETRKIGTTTRGLTFP